MWYNYKQNDIKLLEFLNLEPIGKLIIEDINLGGGLGIDYQNPDNNLIPDFKKYFNIFKKELCLFDNQKVHFELGRSIVGQCGSLISRVL